MEAVPSTAQEGARPFPALRQTRVRARSPLLFLLLLLLFILFLAPAAEEPGFYDLRHRSAGWELHTGDLQEPSTSSGWQQIDPQATHVKEIAPSYEGYYWLRVALPETPPVQDAQLFLRGFKHVEAYVNARLLYSYNMEALDFRVNKFLHWGLIPLQEKDFGQFIYFRVYQSDGDPMQGTFLLGDKGEFYLHMLQRDLLRVVLCILFLVLSLVAWLLWWHRRSEFIYLHFGTLAACAAYGSIGRAQSLQLLMDVPVFIYMQDIAVPLGAASLFGFLGQVYAGWLGRIARLFSRLMTGTFVISLLSAWMNDALYHFVIEVVFFTAAVLMLPVLLFFMCRSYLRHKERETLYFFTGCGLFGVFALIHYIEVNLYPVMPELNRLLPLSSVYTHEMHIVLGALCFVLVLGAVLIERYTATYRQVAIYARELEVKNEQLREMDQLKDDFLARTSHELRTPLYGMIGLAETLIEQKQPPIEVQQRLELIVTSGRRLTRLLNDILDLSKLQHNDLRLRLRKLDLGQTLEIAAALLEPQAAKKQLSIILDAPGPLPEVRGDEDRLEQVLLNLIGNAIKFTPSGEVRIRAERHQEQLRITVTDTGIGIAREELNVIFEPFIQGRSAWDKGYAGTGIGLAVSRQLIELHGGELTVTSEPGVGSSFSFTLPLWNATAETLTTDMDAESLTENSVPAYTPPLNVNLPDEQPLEEDRVLEFEPSMSSGVHRCLLVVDDEPMNLEVLRNQLTPIYHVVTASSGAEAIRWIHQGGQPDLVITDVMMPQMNGYELCRRLKELFPQRELPVIMLTATSVPERLSEGFDAGASDYLTKPAARRELLARVKLQLRVAEWNRSLSEAVTERTAQLEEANQQLRSSMRETFEALQSVVVLEERNRIAHEIHDILGHKLTGAVMQLEAVKRLLHKDPDLAGQKVDAALESVRRGMEDVRLAVRMMQELSSEHLADSLTELFDDTEQMTGVTITRSFGSLPKLDTMHKKIIFHAIQEGLTNGIKHGQGKSFDFACQAEDGLLCFTLRNNGLTYSGVPHGFGLRAMQERVGHLGGTITLESADGGGTLLTVIIPIADNK
jgi:two-component system, sensor histidine kinase ChiS